MKISLISMPFCTLETPSIALSQLKAELERNFGEEVDVNIHYISHDMAQLIGKEAYGYFTNERSIQTGIGDWFFRKEAFPDEIDNTNAYFNRYGYILNEITQRKNKFEELRENLGAFLDGLIFKYELYNSQVVGFTSLFAQNIPSFAMARKLKVINPEIKIVMGGSNCEYPMGLEIIKNVEYIDYVFSGPGLVSFPQFIKNVFDGRFDRNEKINGVFSKGNYQKYNLDQNYQGSIRHCFGEDSDINQPILLDYHSFFDSYKAKVSNSEWPNITIETSKGCWWGEKIQCSFCGLNGSTIKHRAMHVDNAQYYLNWHLNEYSDHTNDIICTDLVLPKNYLKEVIPKIDVPDNVSIFYEVRPDIKERELELLATKNINKIQPGIEALSTPLLKIMNKGVSAANNIRLLKNCVQLSIEPFWNLIIGFPKDREEIYRFYYETLPFLVHLPPPNIVSLRFDRFSEYHKNQEKYNLDLRPYDYYEFIYPFDRQSLSNIAYFFVDYSDNEYKNNLIKWEDKLRMIVDKWNRIWNDHKKSNIPKVSYVTNNKVLDTRSGQEVFYDLDEVSMLLLSFLKVPNKKDEVFKCIDSYSNELIEESWCQLKRKGLIFHEENQQAVSLVFDD